MAPEARGGIEAAVYPVPRDIITLVGHEFSRPVQVFIAGFELFLVPVAVGAE